MNLTTLILMFIISLFSFGHSAPTTKEHSVTCRPDCRVGTGLFVLRRVTYETIKKFDPNNTNAANTVDAIASFIAVHDLASKETDPSASVLCVAKSLEDHFCSKVNSTMGEDFSCLPEEWKKYKLLQGVREGFEKLMQEKFTEKIKPNHTSSCSDSTCGSKCGWLKSIPYKFNIEVLKALSCNPNGTLAQ